MMNLVARAAVCEAAKSFSVVPLGALDTAPLGAGARFRELIARASVAERDAPGSVWIGGPPHSAHVLQETGTMLLTKGWGQYRPVDMAAQLEMVDVIVVNYALHYFDHQDRYLEHMEQLLKQARRRVVGPWRPPLPSRGGGGSGPSGGMSAARRDSWRSGRRSRGSSRCGGRRPQSTSTTGR